MAISKDIEAIFENAEVKSELLTDEVKQNIETLVEARVSQKINEKEKELNEEKEQYVTELDEKYEDFEKQQTEKLEERAVEFVDEHLITKIDEYMDLCVDNYMTENKLEIEDGIKAQLYDKVIDGVKGVLKENSISAEDADFVEELNEEKEDLKSQLNEAMEREIKLKDQLKGKEAINIFNTIAEDLSYSEKQDLKESAKEFDVDDLEIFKRKLELTKKLITESSDAEPSTDTGDNDDTSDDDYISEGTEIDSSAPKLDGYVDNGITTEKASYGTMEDWL